MLAVSQDELYFKRVISAVFSHSVDLEGLQWVVVSHIVKDVEIFIDMLSTLAPVRTVFAKQRTIDKATKNHLIEMGYRIALADRIALRQPTNLEELFSSGGKYLIIDVGGYFANKLPPSVQDKVAGIIECTENGYQRYVTLLQTTTLPYPIYSVARSPLKENEDNLVGHSVGFYAEFVLRKQYIAPRQLTKAIIGYGKVGRGIAAYHLQQHTPPLIYDSDPLAMLRALTDGCTPVERNELLMRADVIFCATGSKSLSARDLPRLKDGCFIVSSTSSDDEFAFSLEDLRSEGYEVLLMRNDIQKIRKDQKHYFMVNQGNAVNFMTPGDRVGSFIRPVQAEVLAAASHLLSHHSTVKEIQTVDRATQQTLAQIFLHTYFV